MKPIQRFVMFWSQPRWFAAALFGVALLLRCYHLTTPLLDTHSWRQADTAAIARNFVASGFAFARPQVDWGGATPGYVESEFPLYTGLLALLFGVFGPQAWLGRLLSALAGAATAPALYALARDAGSGERAARFTGIVFCLLPFPLYFGRTVMPDSLMLLLATLAIWRLLRWCQHPTAQHYALALLAGVLAPLAKTPNLLIAGVPIAALMLWCCWKRPTPGQLAALAGYGLLFGLPALLWTRYAATLPSDPRLSFGIGEKLLDIRLLLDPAFYQLVGGWATSDVLTWLGLPLALVGIVGRNRWLVLAWLGGVMLFLLVGAAGVVGQDYYVLPLAGPGAWLIGRGLATAQGWFGQQRQRAANAAAVLALAGIAALSLLRIAPMYDAALFYGQLGARLNRVLPPGERVGLIAPAVSEILYYAERKGWRLDPGVLVPGGISSLGPDLGVRYLLITDPWLSQQHELLAQELRTYQRVPVGPYALLLDLQQPGETGDFVIAWETSHVVAQPFLGRWQELGGQDVLGLPISDALDAPEGRIQFFERAVLRATGGTAELLPIGPELAPSTGQAGDAQPFASAAAGVPWLGEALGPPANGRQYFTNGALEQRGDGSVGLAATGRWLLDARGLNEDAQLERYTP